jgi:hypothetical protein
MTEQLAAALAAWPLHQIGAENRNQSSPATGCERAEAADRGIAPISSAGLSA